MLTLGVGLGALNTGNNLLYLVLGLQLSTIVISGILSERVLRDLEVRRIGAEIAFAGEPFPFRWALRAARQTAYALTVTEDQSPLTGEAKVGSVPRGEERIVRGLLCAPRRGPVALTGIKVTTTFPFGFFAKSRIFDVCDALVVFPRRVPPAAQLEHPSSGALGERSDPRHSDGDGELHSLRPLRPDEDARRVHWTKSATAGELLRVEREREEREAYTLTVPVAKDRGELDGELDRRCEAAASMAQRLLKAGHPVGLVSGSLRLRPATGSRHERRVLRALALLGFDPEPELEAETP